MNDVCFSIVRNIVLKALVRGGLGQVRLSVVPTAHWGESKDRLSQTLAPLKPAWLASTPESCKPLGIQLSCVHANLTAMCQPRWKAASFQLGLKPEQTALLQVPQQTVVSYMRTGVHQLPALPSWRAKILAQTWKHKPKVVTCF